MSEKTPKHPQPPKRPQPRLIVPKDIEAAYANMVRIAHTPAELVFDFGRFLPGDPAGKVVSKVVMSPLGAKLFAQALTENLAKYESVHGEITIPKKQSLADFLFKPPESPDEPKEE